MIPHNPTLSHTVQHIRTPSMCCLTHSTQSGSSRHCGVLPPYKHSTSGPPAGRQRLAATGRLYPTLPSTLFGILSHWMTHYHTDQIIPTSHRTLPPLSGILWCIRAPPGGVQDIVIPSTTLPNYPTGHYGIIPRTFDDSFQGLGDCIMTG